MQRRQEDRCQALALTGVIPGTCIGFLDSIRFIQRKATKQFEIESLFVYMAREKAKD